jgi:hypothetical protein
MNQRIVESFARVHRYFGLYSDTKVEGMNEVHLPNGYL